MFRKAQLKLFAVITGILVAIFITVLILINILTQSYMQKQSREVLQQIATGTEYDEKTETFSFIMPEDPKFKHEKIPEPPEKKSQTATEKATSATGNQQPNSTVEEVYPAVKYDYSEEVQTEDITPKTAVTAKTEKTTAKTTTKTTVTKTERTTETVTERYTKEFKTEKPTQTFTENPTREVFKPENNDRHWNEFQNPTYQKREEFNDNPDNKWDGGWEWNERPFEENQPPENDFRHDDFKNDFNNDFNKDNNNNNNNNNNNFNNRDFGKGDSENHGGDFGGFFQQSYSDSNSYEIVQLEQAVTATTAEPSETPVPKPPVDNRKMREPVPKTFGSVDFFVLMADKQGQYLAVLNNDDIDEETAQAYITKILDKNNNTGIVSSYQFYNAEKTNGTLIALTDKKDETKVMKQFMRMTVIIGSFTLLVLSAMAYYLSRKSIEPIKTAFEKQKQFISDASHELKTPLTVISANADVLSGEIGENKWLNYIKSQAERMNLLVNDLLSLTRLENNTSNFIQTDFNLSQAVTNSALPFECRAFENNKKFIVDIEDGLMINGSEQHIKQMVGIFIDNALKYSNDGGIVRVKLRSQGERKILSFYNTGNGIKEDEKDKIFERFYRSDDSRSRMTGGYGLGLAIAKSVIDKHKFKVTIENEEGKSICFIIAM
ncbi:MAG: HAMP domain-containing histidine kinase [Ruminococcus sp.]|nr:HAMP domain-containing histidine kinase [Ruminococcus sp.]